MADECISSVEFITSVTLKMNSASQQQQQQEQSNHDVYDDYDDNNDDTVGSHGMGIRNSIDRPDALGMGCEEGSNNGLHPTNGKTISVSDLKFMVARMPTERNAVEYNMNHKKRGLALIFNHEFFDIPSLENRKGTNVDCEKLKKAFKNLDFEVTTYKDCKLREFLEHIAKAAAQDHSDNDCIAIAILTHGEQGYLYAKDVMYKLDTIWHYFSARACPTLAGKPKLFFIQACRGDHLDPGIKLQKTETDGETSSEMSYRIPVHADFLIAYSTIPEATISTKKDCEDLREALNKLGFDVSSYYDYRWSEIKNSVKEAAEKDHSQNDCIVIAILTQGDSDFLWARDEQYKLDSICQFFLANKCPTLAGKPKLFFIEASRGEMLDSGITMRRTETDGDLSYTIPTHADFLLFYSTIPGFQSFQNGGSWFIQSLVAELNKNGKSRDLNTLLTFVNRRVGIDYQSENPFDTKKDQNKQIPCITTMLTRIVRFNDKIQQN